MRKKPFKRGWSFIIIFITVGLSYGIYHIYLYNAPKQNHYSRVSSTNLEQEVWAAFSCFKALIQLLGNLSQIMI